MEEQFIGDYKVLKKIGAGGMAQVFLAVHRNVPDFKVILKILIDRRLAERFKQEANKLALLEGHRNICQIKHFFSHGEDTVIAMEYIDGITVDEKIKSEGKLSLAESLLVINEVLDILDFAHRKGIYHRDIKPSNIMIDKKGQVKVIDFGIAKAETDPNLTLAGSACGTPAYMSPEQFTPTQDTNYALVDVYAAGTTLFTMLTGECPYQGDNEFAIRDAKLFSDVPKLRAHKPDVPKQVEEIVLKSMAKDPRQRFQTASEMQTALDAVRRQTIGEVSRGEDGLTVEVPTRTTKQRPKKRKRSPVFRIVAAVAVLVLAAVVIYSLMPRGSRMGEIDVTVAPQGDLYVDDSLVGTSLDVLPLTLNSGWHIVRVENAASLEKQLIDSIYVGEDAELSRHYEFTFPALTATLDLGVTPVGDIHLDDRFIGKGISDTTITCDTGLHVVRVRNDTSVQKLFMDTVTLAANEVLPLRFRFTFPPPPEDTAEPKPVPVRGEVVVGSSPAGAEVYIDDIKQEHPTIFTFSVDTGIHVIKVVLNDQGERFERDSTILVKQGERHKLMFRFK